MRTFCFFLIFLFLQAPAHAGIYTWVDETGQKHFTDYPPPEKPRKESDKSESRQESGSLPPPIEAEIKSFDEFGNAMGQALGAMGEALGKAMMEAMEQAFIKGDPRKTIQDNSDSCKKIATTYVEEINSKNRSRWEERLHPKVRSCIPGQTDYFDFLFSIKKKKPAIPADYDFKCEAINPSDPLAFEGAKMIFLERPNYRMIIDYKTDKPNTFGSDIVEILRDKDKWYLILPCLTELGLKEHQKMKQ